MFSHVPELVAFGEVVSKCRAANSKLQFGILLQSVFFFVSPPLLFFYTLVLISIHGASAL